MPKVTLTKDYKHHAKTWKKGTVVNVTQEFKTILSDGEFINVPKSSSKKTQTKKIS